MQPSLALIIAMLAIGAAASAPRFSYSRSWGWGPACIMGLIMLIGGLLALPGHL